MNAGEMHSPSHSGRLHALDAVRGFALLLGVALHGANAYVANFPWTVSDEPSTSMAVTVYVIHIFRMTVFFLIAGFFAHLAFHRKGRPAFVRDRLMRVGVPLVAGWFVLMPAMGLASALALVVANGGTLPAEALAAPPAAPAPASGGGIVRAIVSGFPWGHLWFLYMLLGFYGLALAGRAIVERVDRGRMVERAADRAVAWLVRGHVAPLVLGAPVLALYLSLPEPTRWFTIPSPILGLVPDAVSATAFGITFLFGWVLHRQTDLIRVWERRWALNAGLAAVSTGACLAIGGPHLLVVPTGDYTATAIHAVAYVVAIWTWSFAVIGAALTFLSAYRAGIRYVADASYWVYLVHVPVVMVLHVVLTLVTWPPLLKFLVVITVTTAVCLATYQIMVRHTFIGLVLNGRRGGTGAPEAARPPAPAGVAAT
jgi:peptidoglycan/LPS O-acetylase OafA/YrhL